MHTRRQAGERLKVAMASFTQENKGDSKAARVMALWPTERVKLLFAMWWRYAHFSIITRGGGEMPIFNTVDERTGEMRYGEDPAEWTSFVTKCVYILNCFISAIYTPPFPPCDVSYFLSFV